MMDAGSLNEAMLALVPGRAWAMLAALAAIVSIVAAFGILVHAKRVNADPSTGCRSPLAWFGRLCIGMMIPCSIWILGMVATNGSIWPVMACYLVASAGGLLNGFLSARRENNPHIPSD